ncbi:Lpp/OprI family alanine-zipper lipoprotein [Shewanella sp. A3A]|uniref:Major outer membrane lipoprotein Lpp n=1 Tax=Shewanella electrica TaxID=515560 RepID=A0ABT2FJ12_9GAMM|nr:Lpp/OprI family alanine-zipper lipoprotein [Shewanella electrica]MCH1918467.1 Lpp/OprI family alanine-zipper lipoprotein [Shewanella ferrihydritica]MCH1925374.1 Lpp/OprI family alanine-zipper lipoprotein [Shewanella electrica]MCS4555199.1 Lpp/OprI family alanine-zipper lipoprotein [Shewanella electrica]
MNKKVLMIAGVALTAMLGGCANTDAINESVANLGSKVDQLSAEVSSLKSEQTKLAADVRDAKSAAADAQAEAKRANDRLDNVASRYKK